ncbi:MAG TPA: DUF3566 domain-containing protein [Microbacteriaceae bacterium]|nr:DUF3566 domain-containing protein [Microbacteriaceae bacterium]
MTTTSAKKNSRVNAKQVRLRLVFVDFWSVVKMASLLGLALAVIQVVVTLLVYSVLAATGMLSKVAQLVSDVASGLVDLNMLTSLPTVLTFTIVTAALQMVVTTALGAVWATLYNLAVRITGGILVGFTND